MTLTVADRAPHVAALTEYDRERLKLYLQLLDAASSGAKWEDAATSILGIDVGLEPERARSCYDSHLARARWITDGGYFNILRLGKP